MAVYYKPQSPIQSGEDFIYPITTADQIMKSDNSRRLEQAGLIVADNSTSLGGIAADKYVQANIEEASDGGNILLANADLLAGKSLAQIMLMMYPVGAIYISTVATSPASLFGGTWESIGGRFLLGADATYAAGSTGGETTHTLTSDEMPAHRHAIYMNNEVSAEEFWGANNVTPQGKLSANATDTAGGNQPHDNMPPYLAVYMWQRTA